MQFVNVGANCVHYSNRCMTGTVGSNFKMVFNTLSYAVINCPHKHYFSLVGKSVFILFCTICYDLV
jgi:hypothetical protein